MKFNEVVEASPNDVPPQLYLKRAAYFLGHGVPEDWSGVEVIPDK